MAVDDDLDLDVDDAEEEGGGGGKKKLIIIIAAVVLVLVISGVATMLLLGGGSDSPSQAEGGESSDESEAVAEEMKADKGAPPIYLPLSKPFVVSFGPDSDVRFLQLDVQVVVRNPAMATKIWENEPAIRNNLVLLLSSQDSNALSSREGKEKLRAEVLAEIKTVMKKLVGSDSVDDVLFTNFVMQ